MIQYSAIMLLLKLLFEKRFLRQLLHLAKLFVEWLFQVINYLSNFSNKPSRHLPAQS